MDIFEELDKKFDLKKKVNNLSKIMIEKKYFVMGGYYCSFETYFDKHFLRQWEYSYGCNDLNELKNEIVPEYFSLLPTENINEFKEHILSDEELKKFIEDSLS